MSTHTSQASALTFKRCSPLLFPVLCAEVHAYVGKRYCLRVRSFACLFVFVCVFACSCVCWRAYVCVLSCYAGPPPQCWVVCIAMNKHIQIHCSEA